MNRRRAINPQENNDEKNDNELSKFATTIN